MKGRGTRFWPLGIALLTAVLLGMLLLPQSALAWESLCSPVPSLSMLMADAVVAPDGTLWVAASVPGVNQNIVFKITGSCSGQQVLSTGLSAPRAGAAQPAPTVRPSPTPTRPRAAQPQSPQGNNEAFRPQIAVSPSNEVVITWRGGEYGDPSYPVYYRRKPAGSSTFNSPVLVTNDGAVGGVAIDSQGGVHVVWYSDSGGFYRKFNSSDQEVIATKQFSGYNDAEPKIVVDSANNAHVAWMGDDETEAVLYKKIMPDGSTGSTQVISTGVGDRNVYPMIQLGTGNKLHFTYQARINGQYEIVYRQCDDGGINCGTQVNLSNSGINNNSPELAVCGNTPYVTWYRNQPDGSQAVFVSANLGGPQQVGGEVNYPAIAGGNGYMHLILRDRYSSAIYYTRQAESACTGGGPPPTPEPTPVTVDDPSGLIAYSAGWDTQPGLVCSIGSSIHWAYADDTNRTATFQFTGTKIRYHYITYWTLSQTAVYIDGALVATVNQNAGLNCGSWTSNALSPGAHTVVLRPASGSAYNCNSPEPICTISLDALTYWPFTPTVFYMPAILNGGALGR